MEGTGPAPPEGDLGDEGGSENMVTSGGYNVTAPDGLLGGPGVTGVCGDSIIGGKGPGTFCPPVPGSGGVEGAGASWPAMVGLRGWSVGWADVG